MAMSKCRVGVVAAPLVFAAALGASLIFAGVVGTTPRSHPAQGQVERSVSSGTPVPTDVVQGRFVSEVTLDGGEVTVTPAPKRLAEGSSERTIATQIWATGEIMGYHPQVLGFGLATIHEHVEGVPRVARLPAWVGFASDSFEGGTFGSGGGSGGSGASAFCPSENRPENVKTPSPLSPGEAAVIVGVGRHAPAVVYQARNVVCGRAASPKLTNALEIVSVPWNAVGTPRGQFLSVQTTLPRCGEQFGISSGGSSDSFGVSVLATVPEDATDLRCRPSHVVTESVLLDAGGSGIPGAPPPVVTSSAPILHGRVGPMRAVNPGYGSIT